MNPRTVGALALHLTGNAQESFYFMSVSTGRVLNRLHGMTLPMPDDVVDWIHRMACQQKTNPGLLFADRNMNSVDVDNDDEDNEESSDDEDNEDHVPDDEEYDEGLSDEENYLSSDYDDNEDNQNEEDDVEPMRNGAIDVNVDNNLGRLVGSPGEAMPVKNPGVEDVENLGVEHENHDIVNPEMEDVESPEVEDDSAIENQDIASTENEKSETVANDQDCTENEGVENELGYNLQRNRGSSYKHIYNAEMYDTENSKDNEQGEVMMTTIDDVPEETPQISMKRGYKDLEKEDMLP